VRQDDCMVLKEFLRANSPTMDKLLADSKTAQKAEQEVEQWKKEAAAQEAGADSPGKGEPPAPKVGSCSWAWYWAAGMHGISSPSGATPTPSLLQTDPAPGAWDGKGFFLLKPAVLAVGDQADIPGFW
ncbi:FMNL1 isoform 11, partial [Pongo abelii]